MRVPHSITAPLSSNPRKVAAFSILAASFLSSMEAWSTRYLVQLHSPQLTRSIAQELAQGKRRSGLKNSLFALPSNPATAVNCSQLPAPVTDVQDAGRLVTVNIQSNEQLQSLASNPNVSLMEAEQFFKGPDPIATYTGPRLWNEVYSDFKEIPWGIKAVKAVEAWNINPSQPMMGQTARVAVLDTGIDKNHEDLVDRFEQGKNFMEKGPFEQQDIGDGEYNLFANQHEFWEADFFENDYEYFDTNGHGTHVSGTIAASYNGKGVVGVAPQAKILAGRVCGQQGCSSLGIVKGIYWAIEQKVDAINMSLGGANPSRATAEAVKAAEDAGVVVVCASGNDGAAKVSYPAAHPESIAVGAVSPFLQRASFSNYGPELAIMAPGVDILSSVPRKMGRISQVLVTVDGSQDQVQSSSFTGSLDNATPITGVVVPAGLGRSGDFTGVDVRGKIALIARGEIKFGEKVANAIAQGAAGVLIYNNNAEGPPGGYLENRAPIPVAGITQFAGQKLVDAIGKGSKIEASIAVLPSDYQTYSGTSMATPHITGVVALIKAVRHDLRGADVKVILQKTAHAMENKYPNETGAGMVDAELAVREAMNYRSPNPVSPVQPRRPSLGGSDDGQFQFNFDRP